jgi:protein-S-isoprenylcysteine O-methyltransferase Ste14
MNFCATTCHCGVLAHPNFLTLLADKARNIRYAGFGVRPESTDEVNSINDKEAHMRRFPACMIIALAVLIGDGALIAFMIFLFAGPPAFLDLGLGLREILWFDAGLSLLFFIQHSGMVRNSFRRWMTMFITKEYDRAIYAIASGAVLLAMTLCWQKTPYLLQSPDGIFRWSFRAVYWLSLLGFVWGVLSHKIFDPCGVLPIIARLREKKPKPMPLAARGAYLWVRHPLYLFFILMIWSYPALQADRLLFNGLWTIWIVIGAFLEERDLAVEFGETYREYQSQVPMFIPWRLKSKMQFAIDS